MPQPYRHHLPPADLWPTRLLTADVEYPNPVNLATVLLDRHVESGAAGRTAIHADDGRVTYGELQRLTNRIGHALRTLGVEPGDRVAMRFMNGPPFAATWLAVQKIGAIGVSTMPMLRARELAYIVNDSEAALVVCQHDLIDELARAQSSFDRSVPIVTWGREGREGQERREGREGQERREGQEGQQRQRASNEAGTFTALDDLIETASDDLAPAQVADEDVALIAYTSGSTGVPKGATHTASDVLASADCYARHILATRPDDVFGGHPTLAFTFGLGGLLVFPFRAGAATSLMGRFTVDVLLARIAADRITVLFCAATTYRLLLQHSSLEHSHDLSSLRLCVSAGEPLPASVYEEWRRRTGIELLDGIGSTEMFHIFISARAGAVRPGSTGTIVPGYDARVLDDDLREVPRGTPGLLAVRGPTGCRYWRKPARQRDYVRGGWNVTGDMYRQDQDGYFWYQCRNDDLIICGGYNVAGPEIENVLIEHPAVLEAAVVASPDPVRGAVPKAFIVLKDGVIPSDMLAAELQDHVKRELAKYKYPREIEFVTELPRTETGKIKRAVLREREVQRKAPRLSDTPR